MKTQVCRDTVVVIGEHRDFEIGRLNCPSASQNHPVVRQTYEDAELNQSITELAAETGEMRRFSAKILPPWCRKPPKVSEVLP